MRTLTVGDNYTNDAPLVSLYVQNGGSGTVVSNAAGSSTVSVYTSLEAAPTSTIAANANATFTQTPVWITALGGVAQLTVTGPGF